MAVIRFTKEEIELSKVSPLLDERQCLLWRVLEATVEDKPHRDLLSALMRVERELEASGYNGPYLDVAAWATALFEAEDDIPLA